MPRRRQVNADLVLVPEPKLAGYWAHAQEAWLASKSSPHTQRAYAKALADFTGFCGRFNVSLWQVETMHARAWAEHMAESGLAEATVAQRLAAVSAFYSFVASERRLVQGVEVSLFLDARGMPRQNPFQAETFERPRSKKYGSSRPLPTATVQRMMDKIDRETVTGARDYALLLTFLYTGWRSAEVLGMKWGDIAPNPERPGEYVCRWQGKGGKQELAALPTKVFTAIREYLVITGRNPKPGDHIWLPLSVAGLRNFANVTERDENQPISGTQANNVFRKRLRLAGVLDADAYHIHSLRHTFAHAFAKSQRDVLALSKRLHHHSIAMTQVYLDALQSPVDDYSDALRSVYGV